MVPSVTEDDVAGLLAAERVPAVGHAPRARTGPRPRSRPPRCRRAAMAWRKPRLDITVTTTVSSTQPPSVAQVDGAQGDELVAVDERAGVRRRPASGRRRRRTRCRRRRPRPRRRPAAPAGWVEPQPSLMLMPSGRSRRARRLGARDRRSTCGATTELRPVRAVDARRAARRAAGPRCAGHGLGVGVALGSTVAASTIAARRTPPRRPTSGRRASRSQTGRCRPRPAPARRRSSLRPPGANSLMPLSRERVVRRRDHRRRRMPSRSETERDGRGRAARPAARRRRPRRRRPQPARSRAAGPTGGCRARSGRGRHRRPGPRRGRWPARSPG